MSHIVGVSCCPVDMAPTKERRAVGTTWRSQLPTRRASISVSIGGSSNITYSNSVNPNDSKSTLAPGPSGSSTKRRLSQVGAVVSRRLSTTIGWRNLGQWSTSVVATEAKGLCAQYIRARFRRSSICHKKLGLQRLRSVVNMTNNYGGSSETFQYLNVLGKELEQQHPKIYRSVCRQICRTFTSESVVQEVFFAVAHELVPREEVVNLGRIVALFALAGGMAVDCVQQGHVDYLMCLIEAFGLFVERELASWIIQQGGWVSGHPLLLLTMRSSANEKRRIKWQLVPGHVGVLSVVKRLLSRLTSLY